MRSSPRHLSRLGLFVFVDGGVAVGACTIIFNSDNLPRISDAAPPPPDSPYDAHENFDVNPANLTLTSVAPNALVEGTGTSGGRPLRLVIQGENIDGNATITI